MLRGVAAVGFDVDQVAVAVFEEVLYSLNMIMPGTPVRFSVVITSS